MLALFRCELCFEIYYLTDVLVPGVFDLLELV